LSTHVKKRQVVGGVVAVGIVLSNISGSTTETASVGSGPQTHPTLVVVVGPQTLNIDQVNLVKTTETPKVVQVKSGDSQTPLKSGGSGRSSGSAGAGRVPNRASAPHRAMHLNPYRTAPRVQTNNQEIREIQEIQVSLRLIKGQKKRFYHENLLLQEIISLAKAE